MKHFSAAPMDQHIWVNGEELKGNDRRLGELGVTPGAVLMLKVIFQCDNTTCSQRKVKHLRIDDLLKSDLYTHTSCPPDFKESLSNLHYTRTCDNACVASVIHVNNVTL